MQAVGKFDQQDTDIIGNGEKQLAQVLSLLRLAGDEVELLELRQTFDETADVFTEKLIDLRTRGGGIFNGVMQQRDRDGRFIQMHFRQDSGNFKRMRNIRVAIGPLLLAVFLHGVDIGLVQQGLIRIRFIFLNPLNEFVLPHHAIFHKESAPTARSAHNAASIVRL